jgi:hypothetical protein
MAESTTPDGAPTQAPAVESIGSVATAHEAAMQPQNATSATLSAASPAGLASNMTKDVEMSDRTPDRVPACIPFNFTQASRTNNP